MYARARSAALALLAFLICFQTVAASSDDTYVTYQNSDGQTVYLKDDRKPALYTQNYGDCLGNSAIEVTRFDAAYYRDNDTVLFHLEGVTGIANASVMMYIGVYAYGSSRFDLTFNPCEANINSLCPLVATNPILAQGLIPVGENTVEDIPSIAYSIPDFEGQAILRIFANETESEIACFSAVVTNGNSFGHPDSVGTALGAFALIAALASLATAIYGEAVPTMRLHYAHSLSVGVVFAVFQHIFFTGAMSMNWPAVCVAWWSNFAWSGGMIPVAGMQRSIDALIGKNTGNTSEVGAAQSGTTSIVGGGYDISSIYRRSLFPRDALASKATGYKWYGHYVGDGLPLPGNYSGFAGTLAEEGLRVSNAFMTGFLWFLILLAVVVAFMIAFKGILEGLALIRWVKSDRLRFFRAHWLRYTTFAALRTCYIAWFMIMLLAIFQFTYSSSGGVKGVAALVFVIFLFGLISAAFLACRYKTYVVDHEDTSEWRTVLGFIPWARGPRTGPAQPLQDSQIEGEEQAGHESRSKSLWKGKSRSSDALAAAEDSHNIHDYDDYTMKFGWLTARFRRTRWWFFSAWMFYEFLRALFYGGVSQYPLVQVIGLLVIEIIAFGFFIWARPFEGRRLNVIVVYCLGISSVACTGLSAAFDVRFNLPRITTTVIGIIIIIFQGVLTIVTLLAIVVGAISSYMSVSRNHEEFRPKKWHGLREKYFDHLDRVVNDVPRPPKPVKEKKSKTKAAEEAAPTGFQVTGIKRLAKIEDEDADYAQEMRNERGGTAASYASLPGTGVNASDPALARSPSGTASPARQSRANSMRNSSQTNLPFGARAHRPSWSTRDFSPAADGFETAAFVPIDMSRDVADDDEPVAASSLNKKISKSSRTPSHSSNTAARPLANQFSHDSLRVGGDVSSYDTIGRVPAPPSVRPRSGTGHGSLRNSLVGGTSSRRNSDLYADGHSDAQIPVRESSRFAPPLMTPAQEMEEWGPKMSSDGR